MGPEVRKAEVRHDGAGWMLGGLWAESGPRVLPGAEKSEEGRQLLWWLLVVLPKLACVEEPLGWRF